MKLKSKTILCATMSLFLSGQILAIPAGSFLLFSQRGGPINPSCARGSRLILDNAEILGEMAFLSDFVQGLCEIKVSPNQRYFQIKHGYSDRCNHHYYVGQRMMDDGSETIYINDGRQSLCSAITDMERAQIEILIVGAYHMTTNMYSHDEMTITN